ncbi:hypothetical protein ACQP2E_22635 [Actinoplanes sp. CA-015351]|uniref:hypothetical protein n=1 Tax=Actinoplanes sp. CA-015351 TaxID=3239897 RepID=UPI003D9730BE
MMVLFVAVVGLLLAAVLALWPLSSEKPRSPQRFRGSAPVKPPGSHAEPSAGPATLEGILAGQLLSGEISQRQYLRALENLAARDEQRHPLILRWDDRPGAWS